MNRGVYRGLLASLAVLTATGSAAPQPDVHTIVARSIAANEAAWKAAPEYSYTERDRDKDGTKTYQVSILFGSPYERLTSVNGAALSEEAKQKEEQKFQAELAKRRSESAAQRQQRIAGYEQERERDHAFLEQVSEAFEFAFVAREQMASRTVYHLRATPRKGYSPPNLHARALTGMTGDLWIDAASFNWIKVTATVTRSVSIAGFLARVEPGTFFQLEYMPVAGNLWLPKHFSMRARSAVLGVFHHGSQEDTTYSNYRREPPRSAVRVRLTTPSL